MTSLPPARRFDWTNLGIRVGSAAVLAPTVLAAVWVDPPWLFLVMIAVAVALLAVEWGAMSSPNARMRVSVVVTAAVLVSVFLAYRGDVRFAWLSIAVGSLVAAIAARALSAKPLDALYGVFYIAAPCVCLVWLRGTDQGKWWTLMLFAVTWAADIAAFAVGSALKGPKLWPRFSPNKTWSGFVGGLAAAVLAAMAMSAYSAFQLNLAGAAVIGFCGGLATMAGDLWESMLKRRYGVKDSGDLIPGHGGLLDRVDGLMFAVVVMSVARLINHLGWAH